VADGARPDDVLIVVGGEDYDARRIPGSWTGRDFTGLRWQPAGLATLTASTIPAATTPLVANPRPPVTVARDARPASVTKISPPADNTTLVAPAQPGTTNVRVASVTSLYPGDTISIDTGANLESRKVTAPQAVIDDCHYRAAGTMSKVAQVLGKASDVAKYSALAASLATEYNAKYLQTDSSGNAWYANNTEASNAVALDAGLAGP
jgi:hypothetical protein